MDFHQLNELGHRVKEVEKDEDADRIDKVPKITLNQQNHEAGVKECVETSDLSHDSFNEVPSIELEELFLLQASFYSLNCYDFVDQSHDCLCCIENEDPCLNSIATLSIDEKDRHTEHDNKVDQCEEVHCSSNILHLLLLNSLDRIWVVLEVECLVLGINEGLPDPDWEDYVMPPLELETLIVIDLLIDELIQI